MLAFPPNTAPLAGSVVLATPTDDNAANETAGAWLATPDGRPALTASAPPRGWVYEGWIGTQDLRFTMGRFTGATGPDSARPTSGPRPGLDVPGEDLVDRLPPTLRGPVNLADGASTIEVSLEPDRDGQDPTGPGTFGAPVLRARIPAGGGPLQPVPFEVDTTQLPAGVATIG